MPQVCAPRRPGVALNFDLARDPAPVHLDFKKQPSRDYRSTRQNAENMILTQGFPNNPTEDLWRGNGFAGCVQFTPFVGTQLLRPGVKLERDIQISTMPLENSRPLNVTQMPSYLERFPSAAGSADEGRRVHEGAVASLRALRGFAEDSQRKEDPYMHRRHETELSHQRQRRLEEHSKALQGLRSAGLASINPRMGTSTSVPDLRQLRGREGMETWRSSTPWAVETA
uniref:Uncharacterized protein n=1 Tax=Alexandrium catenella TaxID=2925 RepID=A0A7S1WR45_ALECA|mmetsp:Transcript_83077/g.220419  ORF Transcript_83077/g.220419 Transcript_83077/m.220419 type:complete len:227 (+) Transcript_83077:97-777(+)